jgi:hypothetical protein
MISIISNILLSIIEFQFTAHKCNHSGSNGRNIELYFLLKWAAMVGGCVGKIYHYRMLGFVFYLYLYLVVFLSPIFSEIEATNFKIFPVILYGGFIRLSFDSIK